jgi:hypothetical protein
MIKKNIEIYLKSSNNCLSISQIINPPIYVPQLDLNHEELSAHFTDHQPPYMYLNFDLNHEHFKLVLINFNTDNIFIYCHVPLKWSDDI